MIFKPDFTKIKKMKTPLIKFFIILNFLQKFELQFPVLMKVEFVRYLRKVCQHLILSQFTGM